MVGPFAGGACGPNRAHGRRGAPHWCFRPGCALLMRIGSRQRLQGKQLMLNLELGLGFIIRFGDFLNRSKILFSPPSQMLTDAFNLMILDLICGN